MSLSLAVALMSSSLLTNLVSASVIVPDTDTSNGTGVTTITTDDGITVESSDVVSNETDDGIVVNDDGIEITTAHLNSSVHVKDDGITIDNENGLSSGSKVTLSATAENKLDEAVKFKLYFCNYANNLQLPEDKSTWEYLVKDVPEKLTAEPGLVTVKDADGNETEVNATFMQDKDGDTSTASYVEVEVPANSSISFETNVSNEVAGKVFVIPYLEASSEVSYGNAVGLTWEDDNIMVDDSSDDGITVEDDGIEVEESDDTSDGIVVDDDKSIDDDAFDNTLVVDTEGNVISGVNPSDDEHVVSLKAADGGAIEVYDGNDQYVSSIGYTDTQAEQFTVKDGDTLTFKVLADTDYAVDNFVATNTETGEELLSNETTKEEAESEDGITIETEAAKEEDTEAVFTYDVTSDVLIDASFAKVETADVAVDNTDDGIETSENTIADAVIEQYVRDNADPAYTTVDNMDLVNAMTIKNMLVDASTLDSEHDNIDSIMLSGDIVQYWLGTLTSTVPVYELSESSDYFVAYADTMRKDGQTNVSDVQVANHNDQGEVLSGWHYDYDTGLIYIPKICFYEDDKISIGKVQTELMQIVKTNQSGEVESKVETTVVNGDDTEDATVQTDTSNIYDATYTTEIQKGLDTENMVVAVNGIPTDVYTYNSTTGELVVGMSPSAIQSISVNGDEQSLIGKMATSLGLKSVTAYAANSATVALNKMAYASSTAITVQFDKLKVGDYHRMKATDGAGMKYVSNSSDSDSDTMGFLSSVYDQIDNTAAAVLSKTNKVSTVFQYYNYSEKNLILDLSSLDWDGLIKFDQLPNGRDGKHYAGGMYCGHITTHWGDNLPAAEDEWYNNRYSLGMRILDIDGKASQPYITVAICTQKMNDQNAVGIFRFKAKAVTGGILLDKRIAYASYSARFSNLRIDTTFQLYSNKACTKKVGDEIVVKASRDAAIKTVEVTGLKPGIYYLRETGVCNGCQKNTQTYEVRVTAGPAAAAFKNVDTGETHSFIKNVPYYFQGKILTKYDETTKKGIEGVIFRVEYWNRLKTKDGAQCEGKWYLRSGSDGNVIYDNDHLVPDDELHKIFKNKKVNNSDVAMLTEKKWGFPYGQLYIYEVYAPDGYEYDKTKEFRIQLSQPDSTDTTMAHEIPALNIPNTPTGGFLLGKFLYERQRFSNMTPRIKIDTSFGIYKDYDEATGTVSNQLRKIDFKCDEDDMSVTTLVKGLEPGTYYLQELERCPGTVQNTNIYSFEVINGQTTNHIQNVKTGREGTKVGNTPFRFQGKILTKTDADGNALGGAIFKVVYSPYKHGETGAKDMYTWYFRSSDEDGSVSYDEDHYQDSWNKNASDDPFKLDDGTWALPSGYLYVTEVEAPEDYTLDDTEL